MSEESRQPSIDCARNGPYIVKRMERLANSKGEALEAKKVMALCRCGGSANKPFCDGTHSKIGFSGDRSSERPRTAEQLRYEGAGITVLDNRTVCAHAGACTDGLPAVFRLGTEPWIEPTEADAEAIAAVVRQCPSGALSYLLGGAAPAADGSAPAITVSKDGPYWVTGAELQDEATGQRPQFPERYALCRCGQSKNKPFCDGTHWSIEFRDEKN